MGDSGMVIPYLILYAFGSNEKKPALFVDLSNYADFNNQCLKNLV